MARALNRIPSLRRSLEAATTYAEWLDVATELDGLEGGAEWRADDSSTVYRTEVLRDAVTELTTALRHGQPLTLIDTLHASLHRHQTEVLDPALYQRSRVGTKRLVEAYLDQVVEAVHHLCDVDLPGVTDAQRLALVEREAHNVGRSALMLSGGATLGLFHIGVVKALWEADLLPTIVSGASTGSMIAGGLCTRTRAELEPIFADPVAHIDTRVFRLLGLREMRERKVAMSQEQLYQAISANMGDDTFREAFERTGRMLCISVTSTRAQQKPRLLSAITAPDVLVRSASLASCAIPGLFPPGALFQRRDGAATEYVAGERWIDGTVEGDLPAERLARLLNVNHAIVSQTNAHLVPFAHARNRTGPLPLVTDLVSSTVHAQGLQLLDVARRHVKAQWAQRLLERAHGAADQRFMGDITIAPHATAWNYGVIFRNASPQALRRLIAQGERATWPRLHVIRAQTRLSRALEACVTKLTARVAAHAPGSGRKGATVLTPERG